MVEGLRNDHLDASGARLLRAAIRRLDAIETAWPRVVGGLDDLPGSLVHGDFVRKTCACAAAPMDRRSSRSTGR